MYVSYKKHPTVDEDFLVLGLRLDRIGREKERKDEEIYWNNEKKEEYTDNTIYYYCHNLDNVRNSKSYSLKYRYMVYKYLVNTQRCYDLGNRRNYMYDGYSLKYRYNGDDQRLANSTS